MPFEWALVIAISAMNKPICFRVFRLVRSQGEVLLNFFDIDYKQYKILCPSSGR